MQGTLGPILRYPGSKWRLAPWIISRMPQHEMYLEPFFGGGSIFAKKPARIETINDIDGDVINLMRIIRDRPEELARVVALTPWARAEYEAADEPTDDDLERARRFLVRCWQSFGATLSKRTGWRNDASPARNTGCPSTSRVCRLGSGRWLTVCSMLQIECRPALEVIRRHRSSGTLIYADPPYLRSTRSGSLYRHEMTDQDHLDLLDALDAHPGPVMISSYACSLYDERLQGWTKEFRPARAEMGGSRQEVLWLNPVAAAAAPAVQQTLFKKLPGAGYPQKRKRR